MLLCRSSIGSSIAENETLQLEKEGSCLTKEKIALIVLL